MMETLFDLRMIFEIIFEAIALPSPKVTKCKQSAGIPG
jgi:hypothetical protein